MNSFLRYPLILLMLIVTLSCSRSESFFYEVVEPEIVTGLAVHSSYLRNQEITFEVFDARFANVVGGNKLPSLLSSVDIVYDSSFFAVPHRLHAIFEERLWLGEVPNEELVLDTLKDVSHPKIEPLLVAPGVGVNAHEQMVLVALPVLIAQLHIAALEV